VPAGGQCGFGSRVAPSGVPASGGKGRGRIGDHHGVVGPRSASVCSSAVTRRRPEVRTRRGGLGCPLVRLPRPAGLCLSSAEVDQVLRDSGLVAIMSVNRGHPFPVSASGAGIDSQMCAPSGPCGSFLLFEGFPAGELFRAARGIPILVPAPPPPSAGRGRTDRARDSLGARLRASDCAHGLVISR
jgi:hypothetical protein